MDDHTDRFVETGEGLVITEPDGDSEEDESDARDGGSWTSDHPFEDYNPYRWGAGGPRGGQFKSGPGGGGSPQAYVARAVSDPGKSQKQRKVGEVSDSTARLVKAKTGIDIKGQEIRLDHGSLAHAWKNHGPNGLKLRGRTPLRGTDLLSAAGKLATARDIRPGKRSGRSGERFEVRTTRRGKHMTIIFETTGKGVYLMNAWFGE